MQYGKGSKSKKCKPRTNGNSGSGGSSVNAEECSGSNANAGEPKCKGKKPPLPTDICWRCGKARHKKGQTCKALELICRNYRIKGHYEKVCMKKSAHLVNVPNNSGDSEPLYYDELGEPVYVQTYAVQVNGKNKNKHLIQLPVSVNLEKVWKLAESCPTILLKVDIGADVNLLNSTTFNQVIGNRSILQPSTLKMETHGSSRIEVLGKFYAFLRWKGKIYRQPFFMTTANTSPNLLSRDACYTLGVVRPCCAVEAEWSNLQVDLQANLQGLHMADLQTNLQNLMDLQGNLHNQPEIHSIEASDNTQLTDEKLRQARQRLQTQWSNVDPKQRLSDKKHRERSSRHFTTQNTQTTQSTEIVNSRKASADLNTGSRPTTESTARSTHESTGCIISTAEYTRSARATGSAGSTT